MSAIGLALVKVINLTFFVLLFQSSHSCLADLKRRENLKPHVTEREKSAIGEVKREREKR